MKCVLKVCLFAGVAVALGAVCCIQWDAKAKKNAEEIRRVAIAHNRALIAAQAIAMRDGPGRSLTGAESTKAVSIPGWTKASSAFLATEARFNHAPETPPPSSNDALNSTSSQRDQPATVGLTAAQTAPNSIPTLPGKTDHEKPFDSAMRETLRPVPGN